MGKWHEILDHYGLPEITGNKHFNGPCPLCGKKKKFRIDNKSDMGTWICICGAGGGIELVVEKTGRDYSEICSEIDELIGNKSDANTEMIMLRNAHENKLKEFFKMQEIPNTPVEYYLKSRGINLLPTSSLRFSQKEFSGYGSPEMPAMYGIATTNKNQIIYNHCTYLIGCEKARIEAPKKMFTVRQYSGSTAIKLFNSADKMGISEGIESALSAAQLYSIPVWSTINSGFMKKFRAPDDVVHLVIYADNDTNGTGLEAAFACGRSNILRNPKTRSVEIIWPLETGDFNDILINKISAETRSWTLTK